MYIIQFQDIGLATELWGVMDMHSVLHERFVTARITWFTGIDRYLKERAASATYRFQRYHKNRAAYALSLRFVRRLDY